MSLAAAIKLKSGGIGGGWLSMAPQVDDEPVASTSSYVAPPSSSPRSFSPLPTYSHPANKSSSPGYHHIRPRIAATAPRRILPRTSARFKVGDSSALATPASPAPESPYSRGSGYDSPPPFDVRASFAPMPKWGGAAAGSSQDDAGIDPVQSSQSVVPVNDMDMEDRLDNSEDEEDGSKSDDGEKGILHAGIQWKGKTAHAVEQEMEALGDRTVMSYAPDAVYLASRLEGLKRNLEVGGERMKRWAWEDFEDDVDGEDGDSDQTKAPLDDDVHDDEAQREELLMPALEKQSLDSLVSPVSVSEGITPADEVIDDPMQASVASIPSVDNEQEIPNIADVPQITVDTTAGKAAALDARVEIRTLRRPDLEQVRDLNCYHGDNDKVDTETYTTSAGFLLRLLVDEHHVCLVAVAKPLPEPPSLPTRFVPGAPPPSLDMPPSKSPFLVAGQFKQTGSLLPSRKHFPSHLSNNLSAHSLYGKGLVEATAPRSFGVGADSSSSVDEEESKQQESLFETAKMASATQTGDSSPDAIVEVDEEEESGQAGDRENESEKTSPASSISHSHSVLAGPTHDVAPPRAIRVMGAPPLNGIPRDVETILGVASARIKVVQRSEGDDAFGKSEALDSSWPGLDPKGEKSMVTREAHIITLSVLPGERGQGLGARLLDHLLDECKRRTAGPRIHFASGSNTSREEGTAPRVHENAPMRTFLEVHPTNASAIDLYKSRQFHQVEGSKGVVKHYFRGDNRIPNAIRVKVGGSDAIRLERFDFK